MSLKVETSGRKVAVFLFPRSLRNSILIPWVPSSQSAKSAPSFKVFLNNRKSLEMKTDLKVAKDRHRHLEAGELFSGHGAEPIRPNWTCLYGPQLEANVLPRILHGRGDGVLPQTMVQLHVVESPNAAWHFNIVAERKVLISGWPRMIRCYQIRWPTEEILNALTQHSESALEI